MVAPQQAIQQSGFFKLPGELRNDIYRQLLIHEHESIEVASSSIRRYLSLLQVCRQIRHETSSIFYGENTFRAVVALYDCGSLLKWLRTIRKEQAGLLSKLVMTFKLSRAADELYLWRWLLGMSDDPDGILDLFDQPVVIEAARALATVVLFRGA